MIYTIIEKNAIACITGLAFTNLKFLLIYDTCDSTYVYDPIFIG